MDKMLNTKKKISLAVYGVVFVALMLVLALVKNVGDNKYYLDFYITFKLYNPNFIVDFLERMGHCPTFVVPAVACAFISPYIIKSQNKLLKILGYLCIAVTYVGFLMTGHELFKHFKPLVDTVWDTIVGWVLPAVLAVGSTFCMYYFIPKKMKKKTIKKLAIWGLYALICVAAATVIVYILKYSWGRCRFRYMLNELNCDFSQFTPWYKANGFFKGENYYSFPSGHTYSASMVFALPALFTLFPKQQKHYLEVLLLCVFYTMLVGFSRLVIGAHYMSDVMMGGTIGFAVCCIAKYLYFYKFDMKKFAGEDGDISLDDTDVAVEQPTEKVVNDTNDVVSDVSDIAEVAAEPNVSTESANNTDEN